MNTHHIARVVAVVAAIVIAGPFEARAQGTLTSNDLIDGLKGLEQTPNIDVAAMRARAAARAKANADKNPVNREPIAEQLFKLPQLTLEIQFNLDSNIIRHESYPALGRIADALYHPYLLEYRMLVVGHTDATGRREYNLALSQRRADAIREALVTSFKISPARVVAVGLGEEQLQDPANPAAAVNRRVQLVTIGKVK